MQNRILQIGGCWLAASVLAAHACTGMYAGKSTTADGSILIGRTIDFSPFHGTMRQEIREARSLVAFNGTNNRIKGDGSGATDEPEAPFVPTRKSVSE